MTIFRVEFSPDALAHAETIDAWWENNRTASPLLFRDELTAVVEKLRTLPSVGTAYVAVGIPEMKRLLMPRTRYHVYFLADLEQRLVRIHAIWHSARGTGPNL